MKLNEYVKGANKTINYELSEDERMLQAAMGMTGEAAEVMDIIKKIRCQGHELDEEKVDKILTEVGDVIWYLNLMIHTINTTWENVFEINNIKLSKRYNKGKFDKEDSINRVV